jgi:competence protein ComEA
MKLRRPISTFTITLIVLLSGFLPGFPVQATGNTANAKKTAASARPRPSELVDINHADVEELKSLPGIQDALAAKIVKNRPYANKTQLSSKGVIPAATYRKIRALIIAKQ